MIALPGSTKVNLMGLDHEGLARFFVDLGEKPYRAQQLLKWIHFNGVTDFDAMTDLSKVLRARLLECAEMTVPDVIYEKMAEDGTYKWLLKLADGNCIETVYIPEKTRGTLCISSQVGCILNCSFCSTGKQGFNRNLTTAEIMSQLWVAVRKLSRTNGLHDHRVTNVVMMGMGEPLLNLDNVIPALRIMLDDHAYGLSKRRVTVGTAGVVPALETLREAVDVALAVSLHAPNDELRDELVPLNKKYPLEQLMAVCRTYFKDDKRRSITMEYVMLKGVNDTKAHARQLIRVLNGVRAKVNLIPFNPFPHTDYERSTTDSIFAFRDLLMQSGLNTTIRRTRGDDIDAACGQLVGQVQDRTKRNARYLAKANASVAVNAKLNNAPLNLLRSYSPMVLRHKNLIIYQNRIDDKELVMEISNECDFAVDINAEGVGASLKRMRELRELSKEEVAHRLRLQHAVVDLMESGAFPGNLPEIFAKGYIKSYARLLEFSESDVMSMLASLKFQSPLYNATTYKAHQGQDASDSSSRFIYLLTGVAVLIMIALLAIWLEPALYEELSKWLR